MNNSAKSYAENTFRQKLKDVDLFEHKYHMHMKRYFALPYAEDIVLDKLAKEYGENTVVEMLPYFASDSIDEEQQYENPEGEIDEPFKDMDEDAFNDMPHPERTPEQVEQEERLKETCNQMASLVASLTVSLCNVFGNTIPDSHRMKALCMLNCMAKAQLDAASALTECFKSMNPPHAIVYAKRAQTQIAIAAMFLKTIIDDSPKLTMALTPAMKMMRDVAKTIQLFIEIVAKMPSEPEMPF